MAINEDIYKTSKTWKPNNNGDLIFKTTDGFTKILTDNENWQSDTIWDNSNVYTTYNPEKYGINLFGSAISNIEFHLEDGFNNLNEISFEESTDLSRVNLRYCLVSKGSVTTELNMLRWTNKKTDISNFQYVVGSSVDYKGVYASRNAAFDMDRLFLRRPNSNRDIFFVNEIDRNKIFLSCSISTIGFDTYGNQASVKDFTYDELNNTSGDLWEKGYVTDESGNKKFIDEVIVHLAYSRDDLESGAAFTVNNRPVRDENGKDLNLSEYALCILVEKVVDNSVFYSLFPITSFGNISTYNRIYTSNANYQQFMKGSPDLGYHYVYGDSEDNYNKAFTLFPTGTWSYTDLRTNSGDIILRDNHVVYFTTYTRPSGGNTFGRKIITLQEVYRYLSCFLVPFYVTYPRKSVNTYTIYKSDNPKLYLGIRNDETGEVEGDYIPFIWGTTPVEEGLRPDDFEPYDPDNPPETEITPEDKGDIPIGNYPPDIVESFTKFYLMNALAVDSLGDDLWSKMLSYDASTNSNMVDNFFLSKFIQKTVDASNYDINFTLSDVVDYFISLRYYPIPNMQDYIRGAEVHSIKVGTGSLPIQIDKGVCLKPLNFFATIDGGRLYLDEIKKDLYGSFADYEPNVSVSLYVPYLGTYSLQPSTIFDNNMQYIDITYGIDITSGQMVAILYKNGSASFPLCCLQGTIGFDIPISGSTYNSTMTAAKINGQNFFRDKSFDVLGSLFTLGGGLLNDSQSSFLGASQRNTSVINDVANYVNGFPLVTGTRPIMVGTADSLAACLQPQVAYIQVIRHSTSNGKAFPDKYDSTYGFNSYKNSTIGSQTGFIKCVNPRLDGIPCNEYERDEIYNLLTSGVYWK